MPAQVLLTWECTIASRDPLAGTGAQKTSTRPPPTGSRSSRRRAARPIGISSTVLQFDYNGFAVDLLDTPGHKDFSEDTYRVLTAVNAVLMVIDAAKGVESQTRKLFEVCRRRGIPIFTFMNKCDRPTLNPIALLDELEAVLGIQASPVVWPLGNSHHYRDQRLQASGVLLTDRAIPEGQDDRQRLDAEHRLELVKEGDRVQGRPVALVLNVKMGIPGGGGPRRACASGSPRPSPRRSP